jgi:hypothetical protein
MPSTDVPRVAYDPAAQQPQPVYEVRPAYDVPVAVESSVAAPPPSKPLWPWVLAVLALVLGGLVGWLVSRSDDDDTVVSETETTPSTVSDSQPEPALETRLDALLEQTRANGAYVESSEFPQIDEIVTIDRANATESLQGQVDLLSVAQEQSVAKITDLEEEIATLEQSLEDVTAERDELKAAEGDAAMSDTEFLARLQEKEDRISTLEDQLATATSQLTESQNASQRAADDLRTAQTQLQQANATLTALDVTKIENYVNSDITRIRSDAAAKGWVLVEQRVDGAQAAAGTVTNQQPGPGANVIRGSVVYVEYDQP